MSFAAETENLVNELINAEYLNAVVNYGEKYHSLHEGYAVLLEECEEFLKEISFMKRWVKNLWKSVKSNNKDYQNECIEQLEICDTNAIKEASQIGAVLKKIKKTLEEM